MLNNTKWITKRPLLQQQDMIPSNFLLLCPFAILGIFINSMNMLFKINNGFLVGEIFVEQLNGYVVQGKKDHVYFV